MPTVLVVEDDHDIQTALQMVLDMAGGYDVMAASSGAQALELCATHTFDVVLLDAMMPEIDGFTVLGRLRANGALESTRVVMLTAQSSEASHKRAFEGGADAYITKPFHPKDVTETIAAVLARSSEERDQVRRAEIHKAELLGQMERRFT